jgi:hypothetical protein
MPSPQSVCLGEARVGELDQPAAYLGRVAENLANGDAKFCARRSERLHDDVDRCEIAAADPQGSADRALVAAPILAGPLWRTCYLAQIQAQLPSNPV